MSVPAADRDRLTADVLPAAYRVAEAIGKKHDELTEHLRDAAADAVLKALELFDPEHGTPFRAFALAVIRLRVGRAAGKWLQKRRRRPDVVSLPDDYDAPARDLPAAGEVPMSVELADLPADLRDAVRLYWIDGFSMDDASLLCGTAKETFRKRLHAAAELLAADGVERPARTRGSRHLQSRPGRAALAG